MLLLAKLLTALVVFSYADAPGQPGIPHLWAPAAKDAIGTAFPLSSKRTASPVWFTVSQSILTEVFYPTVDEPQIGDFQFLVVDAARGEFSEQKRDTVSKVSFSDPGMEVRIEGSSKDRSYQYLERIVADPSSAVVRIQFSIQLTRPTQKVYLLLKPALGNSTAGDVAFAQPQALVTEDTTKKRAVAMISSLPFAQTSAGYVGFSDGWQTLKKNLRLTERYPQAGPGNVALIAELGFVQNAFEVSLGFGNNSAAAMSAAAHSLSRDFQAISNQYQQGWAQYRNGLARLSPRADFSASIVKMAEDKYNPGAIVASMSKPGLPSNLAGESNYGGYHLVWPRDLYHASIGLLAAGDTRTPVDILRYLAARQNSDGSWAQNFWINGTPYWHGTQMDQVAFPILLTEQLARREAFTPDAAILTMVRKAAEFIVKVGPKTGQDRWEEVSGFIPSTIAPVIRSLKSAGQLLGRADFVKISDEWNANLEKWTVVQHGVWGLDYYVRNAPNGQPNLEEGYGLANGAGWAKTSEILDGGFLHVLRYGLRNIQDQAIQNTLQIYNNPQLKIAGGRPDYASFRRYNRDAYGPAQVGGFWPLLAAEYGIALLERNQLARNQLTVVERSATQSGLIPEQTINAPQPFNSEQIQIGLGTACPLTWAHAEHIVLIRSLKEGTAFDTAIWNQQKN